MHRASENEVRMNSNNHQTDTPLVTVSRIGAAIWCVRHCGRSLGYYQALGDAHRAAKVARQATPDYAAQFAEGLH